MEIPELAGFSTTYEVFKYLKDLALTHGFKKFCVVEVPQRLPRFSEVSIINNWDPEFVQAYEQLDLATNSPIFRHTRVSIRPLFFDVRDVQSKDPTDSRDEAMNSFDSFKFTQGVVFPVHSANGVRGAVSLTGTEIQLDDDQIEALHWQLMDVFQHLVGHRYSAAYRGHDVSERERECLRWAALGKTSSEIAAIIGLSETTVNHHMVSLCKKLDVTNRVHAVAKAIRGGLIE